MVFPHPSVCWSFASIFPCIPTFSFLMVCKSMLISKSGASLFSMFCWCYFYSFLISSLRPQGLMSLNIHSLISFPFLVQLLKNVHTAPWTERNLLCLSLSPHQHAVVWYNLLEVSQLHVSFLSNTPLMCEYRFILKNLPTYVRLNKAFSSTSFFFRLLLQLLCETRQESSFICSYF